MIEVTPLTEADIDAAGIVLDAAYGRIGLANALRDNAALQPDGWFCARLDGEIVGVVGAVDYGAFASIGMMGVHPRVRRQGIALKLMRHLVGWLDARNCPIAFLDATEAGAPLYEKLGFIDDGHTLRFKREEHAAGAPPYSYVRRLGVDDLPAITGFDASIFGARRAAVLAALYQKYPDRAFMMQAGGGETAGYLFAQSRTIGPWCATTPAVAEALLQVALSLDFDALPRVICPASNANGEAMLSRYGFVPERDLRHMRRGGSADPRDCKKLYAQVSFALG